MTALAEVIRQMPALYGAISILDNLLMVTGCAFVTFALFHLELRKKPWPYLFAALFCIVLGAGDHAMLAVQDSLLDLIWTTLTMLLPFICMTLFFRRQGLWKAMLVSFGYTFVDALRYIVLLLFFRYDFDNVNEPLEMLVGFLVNVAVCLLAFVLLTRYAKKHVISLNVTRNASILFLLVVFTVAIFVTSMLLFTSSDTVTRQIEFAFVLLNIPMLTATIAFALFTIYRMRVQSDRYKEQLNMQVRQFEWMEQMNDDLRVFCHDFPKKMRPLILYIDEDKPAEARAMAQQFTDFVATRGERFHTGNYRFDTVLFCEHQLALKDGIRLDVPFDTVFPKEGIDPDDIYTIFPNALDNAIEACRKVEGEKVISLHARISNDTVYVTIRNPVAEPLKEKNGVLQTTKQDKEQHGYGLRSIRKAAGKYGENNVSYSVENGMFTLRLYLRFEPTD
ncbi:MAG: GHKL domain-containing protein [Clostridia bacterium]|nr:GHKL domain-containing protein [Clostridia bacterium]